MTHWCGGKVWMEPGSWHWGQSSLLGVEESETAGANKVVLRKGVHIRLSILSSRRTTSTKVWSQIEERNAGVRLNSGARGQHLGASLYCSHL